MTGSVTGLLGNKNLLDYSMTKGGIHAFVRSLATHLIDRGIRVNAIAPGPVWTPLNPADRQAAGSRRPRCQLRGWLPPRPPRSPSPGRTPPAAYLPSALPYLGPAFSHHRSLVRILPPPVRQRFWQSRRGDLCPHRFCCHAARANGRRPSCSSLPLCGLLRPDHSIPTVAARTPRASSGTNLRQPTTRPV